MGDAYGGSYFVDVLAAVSTGVEDVDLEVFFVDMDVDVFGFGEDSDG